MKYKLSLFLLSAILMFIASCGSKMPFDPRAYNQNLGDPSIDIPDGEGGIPDLDIPIDPENDPFLDPENLNPDKHFPASKFDSWEIRASFAGNNSPTYRFTAGNWNAGNVSKNEFIKKGPNSSGGGHSITYMVYYLYKSKNNLFSPTSSYNSGAHGKRMERFYFYRFSGKGGNIQALDNMLVAVDKNTKLVFAFGVPTKYSYVLGNNVPTAWGSIDTRVNNGKNKFYEYDPVGIVKSDGTVELYKWYTDAMGSGNYNPIIGDPNRAVATYGKPGRSPYYTLSSATTGDPFRDNAKSKEYLFRSPTQGRSDVLDAFSFSMDGTSLVHRDERWRSLHIKNFNYKHKASISKTKAVYTSSWGSEIIVELKDNSKELFIYEYNYTGRVDFDDPGPKFSDRVKNKVFSGSGYTYTFSWDGKEIKLSNGKTYYLTWRDDGNYAVYVHHYITRNHWGVNIRDHESIIDSRITWTSTSWASPSTTPPTDAWYSPANLVK